jgi:hypothetical protein
MQKLCFDKPFNICVLGAGEGAKGTGIPGTYNVLATDYASYAVGKIFKNILYYVGLVDLNLFTSFREQILKINVCIGCTGKHFG